MRCLRRNKVTFYYALYSGKNPITDDYGNKTGEYEVTYGKPRKMSGNVSAARGETVTRQFGEDEAYDRVIVLEDPGCPIDEFTILWIDTKPEIDADGSTRTPHGYEVKKVARSINSVSIAVSKVNVRGAVNG